MKAEGGRRNRGETKAKPGPHVTEDPLPNAVAFDLPRFAGEVTSFGFGRLTELRFLA